MMAATQVPSRAQGLALDGVYDSQFTTWCMPRTLESLHKYGWIVYNGNGSEHNAPIYAGRSKYVRTPAGDEALARWEAKEERRLKRLAASAGRDR